MSNILGIIAEYNPFHNGHKYHLLESKKLCNADYVICVMSGNFTQRGDSSVVDKWSKTEMAILNGVDLVIELPTLYSISSAENFAEGCIKILDSLNLVNILSFGCEFSDINILDKFANILLNEPKEYTAILNHELNKGISYPKARENALLMYLNDIRKYANILSRPNNILAIEYLKSLQKYKSEIKPLALKRKNVDYIDTKVVSGFASATAIRKLIKDNNLKVLKDVLPQDSYNILETRIKNGNIVSDISKFEKEIIYNLRKMSIKEISELQDVCEGLENAIKNAANSCNSIPEFINIVKSKRYTETRIKRILLYTLLGITKKDILLSRKCTPYIRVLGMNNNGKKLLSSIISNNPKLEIITSVKKFIDNNKNKQYSTMFEKDILSTNVYTLGYDYDSWSNLDYTHKIVTL